MWSFAGNIGIKISSNLPFRVFSIPRVNGNNAIIRLKGRDFSSSIPVRYTPKKSLETKEPETSPHLKGLRKNESCKGSTFSSSGNKATYNRTDSIDLKSQAGISTFERSVFCNDVKQDKEILEKPIEAVEEIHLGQDSGEKSCIALSKRMPDAENVAIELLAARAITAVELKKKLLGKKFHPDIVEAVINDFQNRGLINDSLYAEAFSRSRWSSSTWGPRKIKQALFKKGISEAEAQKAVKLVFEGKVDDSDDDQESKLGLSKLSMDHLLIQASKQWLRSRDVPTEKRKSRIIRWLQYRGFNWSVIGSIVKKLESQYPS